MVALDKQFFHHHGTKPRSRGRWRDESWQTGKFPGRRTADLLSARSHRDTSYSSNTSCANEIIYCGYRLDPESQVYYVRNRTYNAVLGRWAQRDPIGYDGGINLYQYVEPSPVGKVDPSGELTIGAVIKWFIATYRQAVPGGEFVDATYAVPSIMRLWLNKEAANRMIYDLDHCIAWEKDPLYKGLLNMSQGQPLTPAEHGAVQDMLEQRK